MSDWTSLIPYKSKPCVDTNSCNSNNLCESKSQGLFSVQKPKHLEKPAIHPQKYISPLLSPSIENPTAVCVCVCVCAFLSIKLFIHVWACAATSNPSVRCTEFNEKPEIPVIKQSMATTTTTTPKRQETQHPKQRREETIKRPIQRKSTTTHSSKNGLPQKKTI
jgi:hypothetical protein